VQINIKNLIDDGQCYQTVRELRWPDGVECPCCQSKYVIKRGLDDTEPACQRYACHDCDTGFADLTDTIFAAQSSTLNSEVNTPLTILPAPLRTDPRRGTTGSSPLPTPPPAGLTHSGRPVPRSGQSGPPRTTCAGSGAAALPDACGSAP
jgi:hypothetical protein